MASTVPGDPYEVLGVPRGADDQTIKKSFRALARELHPDVNSHDPDAETKFKAAAEAYEILSDPRRREIYDQYGHEGLRSGGMRPNFEGFGSLNDLFGAFFGGGFGGGQRGPAQGGDAINAVPGGAAGGGCDPRWGASGPSTIWWAESVVAVSAAERAARRRAMTRSSPSR